MLPSRIDELDVRILGLLAAEPRVGIMELLDATATHQIRYRTAPLVEAAPSG